MTIHINLLDWRGERRERRRKRFFGMIAGVAVVSLAIAIIVSMTIGKRIEHQQARNRYLKQQIAQTERQIAEIKDLSKVRDNLVDRMHVIEELQQDRSATVHFFDELVGTLPSGVYLTSVTQQSKDQTKLTGVAQSNARVSEYMKNLDRSHWFHDPRLIVIKTHQSQHERRSDFTLLVDDKAPDTKSAARSGGGSSQ